MNNLAQDIVQKGLTAARVGDAAEARRLLTQATTEHPDNIDAWLGLAGVVDSLDYKRKCFNKVLEIDPENAEAQAGLALLDQKLAAEQSAKAVTSTSSPTFPVVDAGPGVCYRHPDVETGLRCIKCGKYICTKCAVRTPVGFRCPDCVRELEDKYYTGTNTDYIIAALVAFPLSLVAGWLFTRFLGGFGFFVLIIAFFLAPVVAGFIAEAVRWAVGRRRSRYLRHVVVGCLILGTAPFALGMLLFGQLFGLIAPAMLIFIGGATISARLR